MEATAHIRMTFKARAPAHRLAAHAALEKEMAGMEILALLVLAPLASTANHEIQEAVAAVAGMEAAVVDMDPADGVRVAVEGQAGHSPSRV